MGAKTRLLDALDGAIAPLLARAGSRGRAPHLVDLFAGTGVVGARFADRARVTANDAQAYAAVVAASLLTPATGLSRRAPRVLERARDEAHRLLAPHEENLRAERSFLERHAAGADVARGYRAFLEAEIAAQDPAREAREGGGAVLSSYRNVYFGIAQAALLDGLRSAIDDEPERLRTGLTAALLFAASRATSGTAHFAQPRALTKDSEVRALLERRAIDIEALFRARARVLDEAAPRILAPRENRVQRGPADDLLASLAPGDADVVYADPPYTQDNYSRFYHVLETLAAGRAPALALDARGRLLRGRYPALGDRFLSGFCAQGEVVGAFRRTTALVAERGAALVWSYSSTNGLLFQRLPGGVDALRDLLAERYAKVEVARHPLRHSGAGDKNHAAEELIVVCTRPRGAAASRPASGRAKRAPSSPQREARACAS